MGFVSFNLNYYKSQLLQLESAPATDESIYRAKQLLKILDDLQDEGYTSLCEALEENYQGVSRLKIYLQSNNVAPFAVCQKPQVENNITYAQDEVELAQAIKTLTLCAESGTETSNNPFLKDLIHFCDWIGYEENTAYVFLLRDTLLPYVYYQSKGRAHIYPWLLGRKTLTSLTGKECVDDEIRASIFKALELGRCRTYEDFCSAVLPDIRSTLKQYPKVVRSVGALLAQLKEKQIIVIESGCSGTFPMLLKSLDDRVDTRMYTTYPYLLDVYGDRVYTHKYEENRLFETLYSHDLYFQFSSFKDGRFFVKKCNDRCVRKKTLAEIKSVVGGITNV